MGSSLDPSPMSAPEEKKKPENMGVHERIARCERAIQALLNASTNASESEAFEEGDIQTLQGIVASDDWG